MARHDRRATVSKNQTEPLCPPIFIRLDARTMAHVERAHREMSAETPGVRISQSDVVRYLIKLGLDARKAAQR